MTPLAAHGRISWPRARTLYLVAAALVISKALMAQEHTSCFPAAQVRQNLAERHKEEPVTRGLTVEGALLEIWSSPDGVTWTAIVVGPEGQACIIGTGKSLEVRHHSEEGEPS